MILNVHERLVLLSIIPKEGDYVTLRILRELRMALGLTEEEIKKWNVVQADTRVTWDENGEAEIPIGEKAMGIIIDTLRELSNRNKLNENSLELYEKFIPTT